MILSLTRDRNLQADSFRLLLRAEKLLFFVAVDTDRSLFTYRKIDSSSSIAHSQGIYLSRWRFV